MNLIIRLIIACMVVASLDKSSFFPLSFICVVLIILPIFMTSNDLRSLTKKRGIVSMRYQEPVLRTEELCLTPMFTQTGQFASFDDITGIPICGGDMMGCEDGDEGPPAAMVFVGLCVEGISEGVTAFGAVTIDATIPCTPSGTDHIVATFPACTVAASALNEYCPSGSLPVTCFTSFNCDDWDLCESEEGPSSVSIETPDGSVHTCQSIEEMDMFGDGDK